MRLASAAAALVALATLPARAEPLATLLVKVARHARFPAPTRADLGIAHGRDGDAPVVQGVLLGRGRTVYLETRDGTRALMHPGKIVVRSGGRVVRAKTGARVAGSDLLLEDLVPFTPGLFAVPQVSDDGPTGVVVVGAPARPSARALIVVTIDPARYLIVRTKYYEGSVTNLAAFRRDDGFDAVGGHQRPTAIVVEGLRERTSTRVTLTWRLADIPPEVFTPSGLRRPSAVTW